MHNRGKRMCVEAILPSGRAETFNCMYFDFNWHKVYNYADDVTPLLPAGTMLHTILWHDNTANNRSNPDPRNWIGYGQRTMDEMAFSWVTWTYLDDEDFKKMIAERAASRAHRTGALTTMRPSRAIGWLGRRRCSVSASSARSSPARRARRRRRTASTPIPFATRKGRASSRCSKGWEKNADGTFSMWFGYLNRNYEERLNIPVGPNNGFNGEDMGQAEVFEPRRSRFAFKVVVPANFPKDRDLVWTVTANGVTQKAYGSLWPVWEVDQGTISANRGSRTAIDFDEPPNAAPKWSIRRRSRSATTGQPLSLTLQVEDDGNPRPRVDRGAQRRRACKGPPAERPLNDSLRVSWVQWRGPGTATFNPKVVRVVDGKATTTVTFDKPGNYVLRAYAEDASIHTPHDVSVTVSPASRNLSSSRDPAASVDPTTRRDSRACPAAAS